MRRTRFTGLRFATGLMLVTVTLTTGCKTGGWGGSSWSWNPMRNLGWGSSPPAASSLASATKPSTQVPTPGPTSSVAARGAGNSSPSVPSITQGYGGATAPANAMASYPTTGYPTGGYPTTPNVNGYPTQPAAAYGTPGQPGQVAPTGGYATGPYGMSAAPTGGATGPQQGAYPTYTASAQPGSYQPQPYPTPSYQTQPTQQNYTTPAYNNAQPAGDASGQNANPWNSYQNNPHNNPPASSYPPNNSQPAAQPNNGGYNTGGYMQGGYNSSSNNAAPMPWQNQESGAASAAAGYAAAAPSGPYDAANASGNHAPGTGEYATAYTTPTAPAEAPRAGNMEVSGVTTGTPATGLPASLNTAGGYRPGSTGSGVQNAGYNQPTGYSSGGNVYR